MSYAIFNEEAYLTNYPDVRSAVAQGFVASGLQHFQLYGIKEGRTAVSPFWDEQKYLTANPDVKAAVNAKTFSSGLQHFILFGENEKRPGATIVDTPVGFNENYYNVLYPDVSRAVASKQVASAESQFIRNGRFEGRVGFFSGSSGNDIVTGVGPAGNAILGISVDINATVTGRPDPIPRSLGVGEVDILIGGSGPDRFGLGFGKSSSIAAPQKFYLGQGNNDYAYIINFEAGKDVIQMAGSPSDYFTTSGSFAFTGNSASGVSIFSSNGDFVAAVEGVSSLQTTNIDSNAGIFTYT